MNYTQCWMGVFGIISFTVALWALCELWETRQRLKDEITAHDATQIESDIIAEALMESRLRCAATQETANIYQAGYIRERLHKNRLGRMLAAATNSHWQDDPDVQHLLLAEQEIERREAAPWN